MSNQRLLAMGLVGIAAFIGYVSFRLTGLILGGVGVTDSELFGGLTLSGLIGFALALATFFVAWQNARVQEVGQEIAGELKKVTWPTWAEIKAATVAVVVFSVVAAVVLWVFDFVSSKLMVDWIPEGIRWAHGLFA